VDFWKSFLWHSKSAASGHKNLTELFKIIKLVDNWLFISFISLMSGLVTFLLYLE
jgi:hypothetical protein